MSTDTDSPYNLDFRDVSARFVEQCLRRDGSLFVPGQPVWTREAVDELYARFVEKPDETPNVTFPGKLRAQTAGAPAVVVELAAELLFVLLLPQDTNGDTKRQHVGEVLNARPELDPLADDLAAALDRGIASYGAALSQRFPQYAFLLEFARAWKRLVPAECERLLDDPWEFRAYLYALPHKAAASQMSALLYMVHPDSFEPIVSADHKQKILAAFGHHLTATDQSIDQQLLELRRELTPLYGDGFSYYDMRSQWDVAPGSQRAWLIRGANDRGVNRIESWLRDGYVSIGWEESANATPGMSIPELVQVVTRPERGSEWARMAAGNMDRFFHRMQPGDLVVTTDRGPIYIGELTSGPQRRTDGDDDGGAVWIRDTSWFNADEPIDRATLPADLQSSLKAQITLTEISQHTAALRALIGTGDDPPPPPPPPPPAGGLPPVPDHVAQPLFLPTAWLQRAIDLLNEKRQVIFYGPPGTGKTYVAQALGEHLAASGGHWELVQFHPAYSYEDFFEGYRPTKGGAGGLEFTLHKGPLRQLVDRALAHPGVPHLLVIDEINRGNLPKIFGELYFLLEYRNRPIRLQYSADEEFVLPQNLYIVGTMNTADRSIALVDSALRRRFYFYPFLPDKPPVEDVLGAWLQARGHPMTAASLLKGLNAALQEALPSEEFAIGPSYFMPSAGPPVIERIWEYAIMPLLEERFFGARSAADLEREFGLAAVRRRIEQVMEAPAESGPAPDE